MWKLVKRDTMSDFGLLMTGILVTGQQSSSNLPEQPLVSHESPVKQATSAQTLESISIVQITPPEFMQAGDGDVTQDLSLKDKVKNIVSNSIAKIRLTDSASVVQANPSLISINLMAQQPTLSPQSIADGESDRTFQGEYSTLAYRRVPSSSLPTLEFGNSGISVRVLQRLLLSNGYGIGVDGFFGAVTETAVKAFQNQRNLVADGIVGQKTWAELAN